MENTLEALAGTRWKGTNHLWLDPSAPAQVSDATITVEPGALHYTWAYEGKPHAGSLAATSGSFLASGAALPLVGPASGEGLGVRRGSGTRAEVTFTDSWHQAKPMVCEGTAGEGALLSVRGSYPAPEGPPWGWRTIVSRRPSGELVLQMINVTPWGEEQRAVELIAVQA